MKRLVLICFVILAGLLGLVALVNLLYNVAGLFHVQDAADGPTWELMVVVLIYFSLMLGSFYFCYRMLRCVYLLRQSSLSTQHN
jgi:uncharacterized membrane protein